MKTKTSITDLILSTLERSVDQYVRIEDFTYNSHWYARGYERPLKKSSLAKSLRRLRERGLIEFLDEGQVVYKLTEKGRDQAIWQRIMSDEKWDGKWRVITFDIPENKRAIRDVLRHKLKTWGFVYWQQSVWATNKNCTQVLREYINKLGIEQWVKIIESDNVGTDYSRP